MTFNEFDGNPTLKETMTRKVQTVPTAIKASRGDLGESVVLLTADGKDINESDMLGEIYNFDDYLWLEENACEGADKRAKEFADKVVRSYNSHDDLLAALEANHKWHQEYDDSGTYEGSELFDKNTQAIAKAKGESA